MDFAIHFGGDPEDVLVTTSGPARLDGLHELVEAVISDARFRPGMSVIVDHTALDVSTLTAADMRARSARLAEHAERIGETRVATVVGSPAAFGLWRMMEAYEDGVMKSEGRVFYSLDEARGWLRAETEGE